MEMIIIISLYFFIICFDYIPVIRIQHKKTITVYTIMLIASFVILVLKSSDVVNTPIISDFISNSIKNMFNIKS